MGKVNPERSFAEPFEQFAPPGLENLHQVMFMCEEIGIITAQKQKQPRQKRVIIRREEVLPRKAEKRSEIVGIERLRQVEKLPPGKTEIAPADVFRQCKRRKRGKRTSTRRATAKYRLCRKAEELCRTDECEYAEDDDVLRHGKRGHRRYQRAKCENTQGMPPPLFAEALAHSGDENECTADRLLPNVRPL